MQDKEKRCSDCREIKKREDFAVRTAKLQAISSIARPTVNDIEEAVTMYEEESEE